MVHVTQIILLPLEKDDCKSIQSKSTGDVIVKHSSTKVESFEELASLTKSKVEDLSIGYDHKGTKYDMQFLYGIFF